MTCKVTSIPQLKSTEASWIADRLTRRGSEMQCELRGPRLDQTPIAVVADHGEIVGWAASHNWRDLQTLEVYTAKEYRRRGVARYAAAGLIASGDLLRGKKTAVFRPECVALAESVGLVPVLFNREGAEWIPASLN
jgi:hypothetical protein